MTDQPAATPYRVLARKYRPGRFADLIGQEAMVRTLTNAIRSDRLAHAFMLTGVRGVGKTSTARIIARALNCVGPDGTGGPTPDPCGVCEHCVTIAEDRHMDVLELDAASRTKVEEMRELLDGVRYRPSSARFKIYIIDEVHMLSGHSFNALLKTLEEPPEHVKFVFATTEIRKVPVTVLSRCQRFDLRRVDADLLVEHFGKVAAEEGATVEPEALRLIARAADGSVRDGLSLLDQAIAHGSAGDDGAVTESQVRAMLGLADGARRFDLLDAIMKGAPAEALSILEELYDSGADPVVVLQDLLELTHWITRLKVTPGAAQGPGVSEIERQRGTAMAEGLSMPVLTRAWQVLLKGLTETRTAPSPVQAAEMVLIRLTFAADLPAPAELVRKMADGDTPSAPRATATAPATGANGGASAVAAAPARGESRPAETATAPTASASRAALALAPASEPVPSNADGATTGQAAPTTFREAVDLFFANKEPILHAHLMKDVHLVRFEPGRIELRAALHAPAELASKVTDRLNSWTGRRWVVSLSQAPGEATLSEQDAATAAARRDAALSHPLVRAAMEAFPGATVEEVREPEVPLQDVPAPPADDIDQESFDEDGNEVP